MHYAPSIKILFICSTMLFCCGVCLTMWCLTIPSILQNLLNFFQQNSLLLSVPKHLICFHIYFSIIAFHCLNFPKTSFLCFRIYTQAFLIKVISYICHHYMIQLEKNLKDLKGCNLRNI